MQIAIVAGLVLLNGLLSMSEFAVISSRRHILQEDADAGSAGASAALLLAEQPGRFLSTVQIGITLVGILAGTFGGAAIADELALLLRGRGVPPEVSFRVSLAIVVTVTTYVTLVVGELVPKQLAIRNPERIASRIALPMRVLSVITLPVVFVLNASSRLVLRLLGRSRQPETRVSEDEVRLLLRQGAESGVFRRAEAKMVESVFRLDDIRADAIMTPRVDVVWLRANAGRDALLEAVRSHHGAFPVCGETIDDVVGVITLTDLTQALLEGHEPDVAALARPAEAIPESADAAELLRRVTETGTAFLLVLGEHGGLDGIVTAHDLAEAVLGDLGPAEARRTGEATWLIPGSMAIEEVESTIGATGMRGGRTQVFGTLAGFVLAQLGHIPRAGEGFSWGGYAFTVRRVAGLRVREVTVAAEHPETTRRTPGTSAEES